MKTMKHSLLIMIFCKTNFTQSYATVEPYIELSKNNKNVLCLCTVGDKNVTLLAKELRYCYGY